MQITSTTGVILAGGQARRMDGQDKGLIKVAGKPMIDYVITALKPQVNSIIINANRNLDSYMGYDTAVVSDTFSGYQGPLAGMASSMRIIETAYMACVPCDSPLIPDDLVARLFETIQENTADISVAHNGERIQPVFSLMKTSLLDSLLDFLNRDERKIDLWFAEHHTVTTDFSDKPETFMNVNTPHDIGQIEQILKKEKS